MDNFFLRQRAKARYEKSYPQATMSKNQITQFSEYSRGQMRLYYHNTRSGKQYDYYVHIASTTPNYGGKRFWFYCPVMRCGRRVAILYSCGTYVCRRCANLAYPTQNAAEHDRYDDRIWALAERLGADGDTINGFWHHKPKHMHQKTYQRLTSELEYYRNLTLNAAVGKFGKWF